MDGPAPYHSLRLGYRARHEPEPSRANGSWLGRMDSNHRMAASKAAALPLGDSPTEIKRTEFNSTAIYQEAEMLRKYVLTNFLRIIHTMLFHEQRARERNALLVEGKENFWNQSRRDFIRYHTIWRRSSPPSRTSATHQTPVAWLSSRMQSSGRAPRPPDRFPRAYARGRCDNVGNSHQRFRRLI